MKWQGYNREKEDTRVFFLARGSTSRFLFLRVLVVSFYYSKFFLFNSLFLGRWGQHMANVGVLLSRVRGGARVLAV